jgi:hypothetical protein
VTDRPATHLGGFSPCTRWRPHRSRAHVEMLTFFEPPPHGSPQIKKGVRKGVCDLYHSFQPHSLRS